MARFTESPGQGQSMYAFWITNSGTFGCTRWANGFQVPLFVMQHSSSVLPGQDNTLVMRISGSQLTFWINSDLVRVYTDPSPLAPGAWGMYVISDSSETSAAYGQISIAG
jgi:hypothetical protein